MLQELQTFMLLSRGHGFAHAAHTLGLTQSAVSAQMQRLEAMLGVALFDRASRPARLSLAALALVPQAQQMLALAEQMKQQGLDSAASAPGTIPSWRGPLRIGVIASLQSGAFARVLPRMRNAFANAQLRIAPGTSVAFFAALESDDLDLALCVAPGEALPKELPKELQATDIGQETFVLIAPPDLKVPTNPSTSQILAVLKSQPFIRYDSRAIGGRMVTKFLKAQRIQPNTVLEIDDLHAAVVLVASGLGVSLIPQSVCWQPLANQVRVIALNSLGFERKLIALQRRAKRHPALDALVAELQRELA
jgi:DNA-binding transcriptional LysR family regulator